MAFDPKTLLPSLSRSDMEKGLVTTAAFAVAGAIVGKVLIGKGKLGALVGAGIGLKYGWQVAALLKVEEDAASERSGLNISVGPTEPFTEQEGGAA